LLLFWLLTAIWVIPWAAFLIPAVRQVPIHWRDLRNPPDARGRANLLVLLWAGIVLIFFSFSTRQEYYSLPAIPPLALLIGGWLGRESAADASSSDRRAGRRVSAWLFAVGVIAFVAAETLFLWARPVAPGTQISDVLIDRPGTYTLSLGHLSDLTSQSLGVFRTPLWQIGFVLLAGTALAWWLRRQGSAYASNLALGVMMVGVLFCVHEGYVIFSPEISSKPLALAIRESYQPGDVIVVNGEYAWGSTLNFYTGAQLHLLNSRRTNVWFGSLFPDAPNIFEDTASFTQLWNGPHRVYLFTKEFNRTQALSQIDPAAVYLVARQGNKSVLTNRRLGG
jgi:hypothetical protein